MEADAQPDIPARVEADVEDEAADEADALVQFDIGEPIQLSRQELQQLRLEFK